MSRQTIFDLECKKSRAQGSFVPMGGRVEVSWNDWGSSSNNTHNAYAECSAVYTCIHEMATSAAMVPFILRDRATKTKIENEVTELLAFPNKKEDRTTFWENVYGFYLLQGNVGIEATPYYEPRDKKVFQKEIKELYVTPFTNVVLVLSESSGMVTSYVVNPYNTNGKGKKFTVAPASGRCKMLHIKTFNPSSLWKGLSPIEAVSRNIDTFQSAGEWNQGLLQNSARPSGVFSYDDTDGGVLTEPQYERLKKEINENYTGATHAGVPILLEGGLSWKATGMTPQEMEFLSSRASSGKEVAAALGYPPQLLANAGDNTYNNQKEARLSLWTDTLMPLTMRMGISLTAWLSKLGAIDGKTQEVVPVFEEIGALQAIRDSLWEKAGVKGKDILTINERRDIIGFKNIPGMDGIVANAAQVPLEYALRDPSEREPVTVIKDNITKKPNKNKDAK